jgi:hypothetical protein
MFFTGPRNSCCFDMESYIRACQYLLFASSLLQSRPLTNDEAQLVEYYRQALANVIGTAVGKK